jgi:asparagine synthetase B (glutamine-hydrolysing)
MCGLFGMAGAGIHKDDLDILDELMLVSSTRGTHGTGLASGAGSLKPTVARTAGDVYYWKYEHQKEGNQRLLSPVNTYFIGHTRWRSMGSFGMPGVQPYALNRVVGTHNGSIFSIADKFEEEKFPSDSAKFLSDLNDAGENIIPYLAKFDPVEDSYALVWYDRKKKVMHAATNGKRSLAFATHKKRSVMYWASELRFLHFALNKEDVDYWIFQPNKLYTWNPAQVLYWKVKDDGIEWLEAEDIPPFVPTTKVIHIGKGQNGLIQQINEIGATESELAEIPWMRDTSGKLIEGRSQEDLLEKQDNQSQLRLIH